MTRDERLTRHLAEKVMGWKYCGKLGGRSVFDTPQPFDPLNDANDALNVLEKHCPNFWELRSWSFGLEKTHVYADSPRWSEYSFRERQCRMICEVVGKATGFKWEDEG